eukprot:maker-scaffold1103_size62544-snap-gene-0.11 protein:Tk04264 transcript:maker-scaffold1103_size62544-snap-gene-0.11-mRNA-1 annotation:"ribosome biogenesis protein tsr1"
MKLLGLVLAFSACLVGSTGFECYQCGEGLKPCGDSDGEPMLCATMIPTCVKAYFETDTGDATVFRSCLLGDVFKGDSIEVEAINKVVSSISDATATAGTQISLDGCISVNVEGFKEALSTYLISFRRDTIELSSSTEHIRANRSGETIFRVKSGKSLLTMVSSLYNMLSPSTKTAVFLRPSFELSFISFMRMFMQSVANLGRSTPFKATSIKGDPCSVDSLQMAQHY